MLGIMRGPIFLEDVVRISVQVSVYPHIILPNVQALATLPAGASVETGVEVESNGNFRRNRWLVGVAQPRLVRCVFVVILVMAR